MHRNYLAKAIFKYFEQTYGKGKDARVEGRTSGRIIFFEQEVVFSGVKLRLCLVKHQNTRMLTIFDGGLKTASSQGKVFSVMSCLHDHVETQYFHYDSFPSEELIKEIHKLLDRKDPKLKEFWPQKSSKMLYVA